MACSACYDMDQLATALIMFAQPHPVGPGGLVSIHDSGGERQLLIDLAHDADVPLTQLAPATTKKLASLLDPGLPPVNPLDAWSTGGPDYHVGMQKVLRDADVRPRHGASVRWFTIARRTAGYYEDYLSYLRVGHAASGKPAFLVANARAPARTRR